MRIGIFGGTFDPPHIGHLILADEASKQLELDQIFWVPASKPPHKMGKYITDIQLRVKFVQKTISGNPQFFLSDVDVNRPAPHYAVDTMDIFQSIYRSDDLIYLMGGDSLLHLNQWHKPKEFVEKCTELGVMKRPGMHLDLDEIESNVPGIREKTRFIEAPEIGISASQIRTRIKDGLAYRYYLPPAVYRLIMDQNLYR